MREELPAIGLGTDQHDSATDCAESVRTALEVGYRHVDTAQSYDSEGPVGEGLAAADVARDDVVVATKLATENLGYEDAIASAEESCRRLGVDTIDLLYVHWPIDTYDPDETLPALDALHDRGVIRYAGLSNFTPDLLTTALDRLDAPVLAHQVECHPLLPQTELRELAARRDHHLVAYSPLAKTEVFDEPTIRDIADEQDVSPAQVCLAWHVETGIHPIPKATGRDHIADNLAAADLELPQSAIDRIDAIDRRERVIDFDGAPWNAT